MKNQVLLLGGSGYIGSALQQTLTSALIQYTNCDLRWFGGPEPHIHGDYKNLSADYIQEFSHVVVLAAHSSMAMCADNWASAWNNNVVNLAALAGKMLPEQTLIYASSGSVYGNGGLDRQEHMSLAQAQIEYDLTKQIGEQVAAGAQCRTVGLRFGTLSGANRHARSDLMLNAMTISAQEKGRIDCYNGHNHRSILGINDCVRAILAIIKNGHLLDQHQIFNLASFGGSIESFAERAGSILGVPVISHPEVTNNFSFELNSAEFARRFNFHFLDSAETIIKSIVDNYTFINWSPRVEKIQYV